MRKVLITGAAGFIGSELAKFLSDKGGYDLTLIDNLSYGYLDNLKGHKVAGRFQELDIRSRDFLEMAPDFDCIFHFAGVSSLPECETNPQLALDVNSIGVANLLESLRSSKGTTRLIFSSTSAVYENSKGESLDEESTCAPDLIYSQSKYFAESLVKSYHKNYGIDAIICRFFNVYGPHQDFRRLHPPFTSYLVREVISGRKPTIYNLGLAKRDYIYISDLLNYLKLLMEQKDSSNIGTVNLCSGDSYSAIDIHMVLEKITGRKIEFEIGDPKDFWAKYSSLFQGVHNLNNSRIIQEVNKNAVGNPSKIREITRYVPKTDLFAGLKHVISYQKDQNG
jgi:UDP-glucose 4-epimerase